MMTGREFTHGVVTLGLGWSLALGVFFVGIRFINGRFMSSDLSSLLMVTAVAATAQFLSCAFLISVGPQGSRLIRRVFGAAVGVATAIIPVLVVNTLVGVTELRSLFHGIEAVFLAMFCMSGLVFGASLASITPLSRPRISG